MNKRVVFIADVFADQVPGGGELNNDEFILELSKDSSYRVEKCHSHLVTPLFLEENKESSFIVGNFLNIAPDVRRLLTNTNYIIYEHDHKYIKSRNPADYKNFKATSKDIINYDFYAQAAAVLCQSNLHASIVKRNLELDNIINLGGNLWSLEILSFLKDLSERPKVPRYAVVQSTNWHKNTYDAAKYCAVKKIDFTLVRPAPYKEFLAKLGENEKLVFFPQTPETLSRIVVEARMMGMGTLLNKNVGATSESWFELKGAPLVDFMIDKRQEIINRVKELL